MNRSHNFRVNQLELKVSPDELLFDLIYVILISKISQLIFAGTEITYLVIGSSLLVFGTLMWVWLLRVNHLNRIHILQAKLDNRQFKSEWLTYFEIILLITALYMIKSISLQSIMVLVSVGLLISFLSISRIRHKIISDAQTHQKFHEVYKPESMARQFEVNVEYVYERLIIILVLFLGEILSTAFVSASDVTNLFLIVVLVVSIFNANVKILAASHKYLISNPDYRVYHGTLNYTKALFTLMLGVLISLEAAHEVVFATTITLIVLVIYIIFEQRMKTLTKLCNHHLIMIVNLITILILVFTLPIPALIKAIWGVIVFGLNMFYTN